MWTSVAGHGCVSREKTNSMLWFSQHIRLAKIHTGLLARDGNSVYYDAKIAKVEIFASQQLESKTTLLG
jgi:hypothetical protein